MVKDKEYSKRSLGTKQNKIKQIEKQQKEIQNGS